MLIDRFLRLAAALAAVSLAGCASGPSDIEVGDTAFIPSARVSVPIFTKPSGMAPSTPQNGHVIEASYTGAKGSDKQELESGDDDIVFGGQTFVAPVNLKHEYNFKYGEIVYRWRKFFGGSQTFGMEALGGIGHSMFYLTTTGGGGQAASHKYNTTGLALGIGGIWKFRPDTSLQVRLSGMGSGDKEDISASRFDIHVVHAIARNIAIRGGLTSWHVSIERFGSDIDASFSGPAIALDVAF